MNFFINISILFKQKFFYIFSTIVKTPPIALFYNTSHKKSKYFKQTVKVTNIICQIFYLAYSTERVSRITLTLISPG